MLHIFSLPMLDIARIARVEQNDIFSSYKYEKYFKNRNCKIVLLRNLIFQFMNKKDLMDYNLNN